MSPFVKLSDASPGSNALAEWRENQKAGVGQALTLAAADKRILSVCSGEIIADR